MKLILSFVWPVIFLSNLTGQTVFTTPHQQEQFWYADALILKKKPVVSLKKPVVIAVVDDGFRLTHELFQKYLYKNSIDSSSNFMDDDNNGFTDDYMGWDVSDNDNDVSVPQGRESLYLHGTFIAGIITQLAEASLGADAYKFVKILPVKALSSNVGNTYIKDGYKGIEYALAQQVDIICCAWNGGNLSAEQEVILKKAQQQGVMVIAAAGNSFSEIAAPPASHKSVIAIAAVDDAYKKTFESNYGEFIDLCAPGKKVIGADVKSDKGILISDGTSAAVATATSSFAILKILFPNLDNAHLLSALKNTAELLKEEDSRYLGKLGAGFINLNEAIAYLQDEKYPMTHFNSALSEGVIEFNNREKKTEHAVEIRPKGDYKGIQFEKLKMTGKPGKSVFKVYDKFMAVKAEFPIAQMPASFFVSGNVANVVLNLKGASKNLAFDLAYEVQTIDSATLYCKEIKYFELDEGSISDGSKDENYTNYCSCKWIITVPDGKRIHFKFDEMDTQANMDYVYLFDGETAIPSNIIGKFSGQNLPPEVTSRSNSVLVWFVTDKEKTGKGWNLQYKTIP